MGWCGTTSLYYTLTRNQKYLHTGVHKEPGYLRRLFEPTYTYKTDIELFALKDIESYIKKYDEVKEKVNTLDESDFNYHYFKNGFKFSKEELYELFKTPSIDKYIQYHLKISEYTSNEYVAVGDFSNCNQKVIDKDFLTEVKNSLSEYFDVKVLLMVRDPVRRIFSVKNSAEYRKYLISKTTDITCPSRYDRPENWKELSSNNAVKENLINETLFVNLSLDQFESDYAEMISTLRSIFNEENVCYLIMEEFFKSRREVEKLEKFINFKLPKIHPCVFVPDLGIYPPKLDYLEDQHSSDWEILDKDFYMYMKKIFSPIYASFENLHGSLPETWGRPIDY